MAASSVLLDIWKSQIHKHRRLDRPPPRPILEMDRILDRGWRGFFEELKWGANTERATVKAVLVCQDFLDLIDDPACKASYDGIAIVIEPSLAPGTIALEFTPFDPAKFKKYPIRRLTEGS